VSDEAESDSPGAQLAKLGASKGGRARASQLSPNERSRAARDAAEARWGRSVASATHEGELIIGDKRIECAVLNDGTRVISQGTVLAALGRAPTMGRRDLTEGRPPLSQRGESAAIRITGTNRAL